MNEVPVHQATIGGLFAVREATDKVASGLTQMFERKFRYLVVIVQDALLQT
jgi:hypothetical protein